MYFQDLQALLAVLTKEIKMCLSFSGKALTCTVIQTQTTAVS
jgi:hypothetical protein